LNFLKRAILSVTRKKSKTFIMFIIFAAIANMVLAGFAIQHATEYAGILARQKLGGQLTLRYDMQKALEQARAGGEERPGIQAESVTEDMVEMIASQKNIVEFNYIVNTTGIAEGFQPVVTEEEEETESATGNQYQRPGNFGATGNFVIPDVTVEGVSTSKLLNTFSNNEDKVIEGRHITPEDSNKKVALIEKNLAEQNGLKVGGKIKIKAARSEEIVEFSIVGIYETSAASASGTGMGNFPFTQPYNKIITDYKSVDPLKSVATGSDMRLVGSSDTAVFLVDDPKNIDQVLADAKKMDIDWEKFTLDANDLAYQQMMGPIENVASFSKTVIYIVAIAGAIILALILTLSIKERMYETGVLLSMGEGKSKIIAQYVAEVLLIALVAFSLSIFSGQYIAQGVGNMLLERESKVVEEQSYDNVRPGSGRVMGQMQGGLFGRQAEANDTIDSLDVRITFSEVEKMAVAGLIITLAGTILPAASVMRFKPKTILTKAT